MRDATPVELAALNAWAAQAAAELEADTKVEALHERISALSDFSAHVFPRVVHALPVLYMFSGSDLLTAMALFPMAPEYHLVADFAPGHPACFIDPACIAQANETTTAFFRHWASLKFARQSTNLMRRAFATSTGQLPALLVSLRLIGLPVLHATTHAVELPKASNTVINRVRVAPHVPLYRPFVLITSVHRMRCRSVPKILWRAGTRRVDG